MLIGREHERRELFAVVTGVREATGAALVLRGPAGIGKSTLLADLVRRAHAEVRVLPAEGVESEIELPFASLHQLLRPLLAGLPRLPGPQATALRAAFGMDTTAGTDRFLVALAALGLLSEVAREAPLLLVVDDAQWLDSASADALVFVARRLGGERVAAVFAARDGARPFAAPGVPELRVCPLPAESARLLLDRSLPSAAPAVRERLLREAEGNPLALRELPGALSPGQLAGRAPLPEELALTDRLQQIFHYRASDLPTGRGDVLLLVAAENGGDLATVLAAAEAPAGPRSEGGGAAGATTGGYGSGEAAGPTAAGRWGDGAAMGTLCAAASAGLIHLDQQRVRFRHPLIRSAVYQHATLGERRAAHLALARALGTADDRHVWHLAAATVGTDDSVARLLGEVAGRARRAGGVASAARALRRAAALAPSPRDTAHWLIEAADCAWAAADPAQAEALLQEAESLTADPGPRARAARVRGAIAHASSDPALACSILLRGARPVLGSEPELAEELLVMAARSAWVANAPARLTEIADLLERPPADPANGTAGMDSTTERSTRSETAGTAERITESGTAWRSTGAGATGRSTESGAGGTSSACALAGQLAAHFRHLGSLAPRETADGVRPPPLPARDVERDRMTWLSAEDPRPWVWPPVFLPCLMGDTEGMLDAHRAAVDSLRAKGAAGALPMSLAPLVALQLATGQWPDATTHGEEALVLADGTGQLGAAAHLRAMLAWLRAARGDSAGCRELVEDSLAVSMPRRIASAVALAHWAMGLSALAERQSRHAAQALGEVAAARGPAAHFMVRWLVLPDLVEACVRCGEPERAGAALREFEERAVPDRRAHLRGPWLRCRALLAPGEEADALFRGALAAPWSSPFEIGRVHLLYGEWLRRARRVKTARAHLHQALGYLGTVGALPWAELARQELRAAGDRTTAEPPTAADPARSAGSAGSAGSVVSVGLTPRELQITRLAAQGLSNREIAARLFLSPRTVGYHLYKVFPKVGVTSRSQLYGMTFG
ncbi:AAA family ATPase [Streptomyces sp. URMC 123]|uniref:helix-turn-helix transcriptional regulator n=1 Tax=Streptomyces sp. URMC 123 TaxID=3423403 RepID=UPI003F1C07AD